MPDVPASVPPGSALGMVETFGLVAAIEAADAMLKAADVRLVRKHRVDPGMITHIVVGETAAVRSAVDAGAAAAARVGRVIATHVIARPSDDVWRQMLGVPLTTDADDTAVGAVPPEAAAHTPMATPPAGALPGPPPASNGQADADEYAAMTVRDLRALARSRDDIDLRGRAVATASKDDLVAQLRAADAR